MREIKFRAWDKKLKKFIDFAEQNISLHPENGSLFTNSLGEFDVTKNLELMQYTGLKDKNGKEIYEGDIIQGEPDYNFLIEYQESSFVAYQSEWNYTILVSEMTMYEVIGNIYENPELLE